MSSLLRSTKFIRYFTGAARTLILNTAKTTEVNSLNVKTLSAANNVLLREYATSKKAESLEPLLQRLDSEVRRYGRITKRDVDEVFDELRTKNDVTSSQSLLVIRCCGELVPEELPEQRTLLVQKIWNVLIERGISMDISHYNALLRVYIENEHPFSPAKLLEELQTKGLQPNRVTYQRLMWRYCQEGDVVGATKVLEKMRELNFPVSEPVLNALVMGHAFHGDTDGAKAVLETMAGAGLQPTNHTYTLLACGFARQGNIEGINNVIKTATDKDIYLTDKDILDIIEQLALGGHGNIAGQLFGHLQKSVGYNQDVCNLILKLLNKGQIETAKNVMKTMPKATNIDDTMFKGAFFIKQLIKTVKDPETFIKICGELKEEELVPNSFYIATETAMQSGHMDLAQRLFQIMEKEGVEIRQHYYWPLLAQKGKEGDEEGLIQILRTMSERGILPNGETLRDYVIPYLVKKDSANNVILKMQIANVPVILCARSVMVELLELGKIKEAAEISLQYRLRGQYGIIKRPLLNALTKTKDIDSFVSILHVISSKPQSNQGEEVVSTDDNPSEKIDSNEVGPFVISAIKSLSNPDLAEKLLKALHSKGLRINIESAEAIQQYLDKNMTTELSELITKLTSNDLEPVPLESTRRENIPRTSVQLEQLLDRIMKKDGYNVTRIQKQLLSLYIKENNIEKLNSFLEELKALNFELTATTLGQLYECYCNNNNIDRANQIKAQLNTKYPDYKLNNYKLVIMAAALIKDNKFVEAIEFLNENKPLMEAEGSFTLNSKCWQILNTLAEEKDDSKVLELTKTLIENKYIEPSNVVLGPSIKVFLLKDDLEGAMKQFEICCNQFRCTPWKGELMKTLINKEDANKLQWIADLSTQIHGEVNILHDLVLAFVECGRLRQARRILETPGLHTRQRRLDDACVRYVEEGKSECLEGLLEATRELSHIDRSNIFYHLLKTYCKAKETDKALGLWTLLQEEDEVPSEKFLIYLSKHLKANKRPVPFIVPSNEDKSAPKKQKKVVPEIKKPTKNEITSEVEKLIQAGKVSEAFDVTLKSIDNGVIPKQTTLKYILKVAAEAGLVEKIEEIGKLLSDTMRRRIAFDDKLTLAKFHQGSGSQHVDKLLNDVESARAEDLEGVVQNFPRSKALETVVKDEELVVKCHKIAEISASRGYYIPVNLLWMEYILAGKEKEANALWEQWLIKAPLILFRRLLQESHSRNEPKLIEKLITTINTNPNITLGTLGNVYSRLIDLYLANNKLNDAEQALKKAIDSGVTAENFNKNCILRFKTVTEQAGKEFNYFN